MKHNHHDHDNHLCETHLGLCKRCDVVYCVECGKEWGHCKLTHYPYYVYTTPTTNPPYWTTTTAGDVLTDGTGDITFTEAVCSHA